MTDANKPRDNYLRDYYQRNRERLLERQRIRYHANRDKERAYRVRRSRQYKAEVIQAYGGACACCGETQIEFLSIDHINGKGKQHRKNASGVGHQFFAWLKRQGYPKEGLRVLCHNCNQAIGLYGYCPHQSDIDFLNPPFWVEATKPE
jgi:hypothetical protein